MFPVQPPLGPFADGILQGEYHLPRSPWAAIIGVGQIGVPPIEPASQITFSATEARVPSATRSATKAKNPKKKPSGTRAERRRRENAEREERMQRDASIVRALKENRESREPVSLREIARRFNVNHNRVQRLNDDRARLDGSLQGRPTHLSLVNEGVLILKLRAAVEKGEKVDGARISEEARMIFIADNPNAPVPAFNREWRRSFNKRHPENVLKIKSAKGQAERRASASTRGYVNHLMQGIKNIFRQLRAPGDPMYFLSRVRVLVVDEVDITNETAGVSAGTRSLHVGKVKARHSLSGSENHVTAIPLVSLRDGLISCTFVVAAPPTVHPDHANERKDKQPPSLADSAQIVYNSSGSSEGCDSDGLPGSWQLAAEHFVKTIDGRYGKKGSRDDFVIIMDGFVVHKSHRTLDYLADHGIQVIILAPNATHLVQISDHPRMNGKLQERLRSTKAAFARIFNGCERPIEERLAIAHNKIMETFDADNALEAAVDIGYVVDGDRIGLTDESITAMLDKKQARGEILSSPIGDESNEFRSARFLLARDMVSKSLLPVGTASLVSAKVVDLTLRSSLSICPQRSISPRLRRSDEECQARSFSRRVARGRT
jgi:hypothetical protein